MSKQTELTGTFKYSKTELLREGYDPEACGDALYFDDPSAGEFVPLNAELYRRILCGEIKL
jgi:fatty-acyl-CoA synthase